jgi:hypothetical protein
MWEAAGAPDEGPAAAVRVAGARDLVGALEAGRQQGDLAGVGGGPGRAEHGQPGNEDGG